VSVNSPAFRRYKAGLIVAEVQTVGENLRAAREAAGLTQGELADLIGVSVVSVSSWERDVYLPTEDNFRKLGRALKTTPGTLRYGPDAPSVVREESEVASYFQSAVPFSPNPSLRKRLRPRHMRACTSTSSSSYRRVFENRSKKPSG
jgi:putative transcriptional regulator